MYIKDNMLRIVLFYVPYINISKVRAIAFFYYFCISHKMLHIEGKKQGQERGAVYEIDRFT